MIPAAFLFFALIMSENDRPDPAPPPDGQLLFSGDVERAQEIEEGRGVYTLERARIRRPGLIEAIVAWTAQGHGQLAIAAALNCSHRTVSTVQRHPDFAEAIAIAREKRISRLRSAADKLVELIDNNPESVPPGMRALAAAQLLDKAELLGGGVTARIGHKDEQPAGIAAGDWESWLRDTLPTEKQLEPGQVRELEPGGACMLNPPASHTAPAAVIGLGGEEKRSIREPQAQDPADLGAPAADLELGAGGARGDALSAGLEAAAQEQPTTATDSSTDPDDTEAADDGLAAAAALKESAARTPPGGALPSLRGASHPIRPTDQKFSGNSPKHPNP